MSGVLGTQAYKRFFGYPTSYTQGAITASMPAGSLVGALASSITADRLSRKAALQSEVAPKEIRGRVVSLQQWAITWGILIQFFIQYGVAESVSGGPRDPAQSTAAFRIPWAVQMVPAVVLLVSLYFCPHSPRWLATRDRWREALLTLAALHESTYGRTSEGMTIHDPRVRAQYREIEDALRFEREQADGSFAALIKGRMYVINVVLTLPAILFLDKWGRRPSLVIGSFLMMAYLFISGALQHHYGRPNTAATATQDNKDISWVVVGHRGASWGIVVCSYLFVATFATTWGPTSWTYPAEIFPSRIRARAVSVCTAANWLFNMVLAFAVPPLLWHVNYKTYYIFGSFNAAAFLHMLLMAHETKGYTLEQMDDVFDRGGHAWERKKKSVSRVEAMESQVEASDVPPERRDTRDKSGLPCTTLAAEVTTREALGLSA
ncbi:hypothetical protein ACCO45_008982 [Purpureocillium lilacinum]|uniref:Uncharacterized protein n=1 Tax=Purpureocillium lilacinum TaxID=33203 RepID=A0ACC4DIP6_PURLI